MLALPMTHSRMKSVIGHIRDQLTRVIVVRQQGFWRNDWRSVGLGVDSGAVSSQLWRQRNSDDTSRGSMLCEIQSRHLQLLLRLRLMTDRPEFLGNRDPLKRNQKCE